MWSADEMRAKACFSLLSRRCHRRAASSIPSDPVLGACPSRSGKPGLGHRHRMPTGVPISRGLVWGGHQEHRPSTVPDRMGPLLASGSAERDQSISEECRSRTYHVPNGQDNKSYCDGIHRYRAQDDHPENVFVAIPHHEQSKDDQH